jgi:hypothetical protein
LLNAEITKIFAQNDREILLLDSGSAVALRVASVIESAQFSNDTDSDSHPLKRLAVFTKTLSNESFKTHISDYGFTDIHLLSV